MGMLALLQPAASVLHALGPSSKSPVSMCSTSLRIPLQARLWPAHVLRRTALSQGARLPRCERWVLLRWAGGFRPPASPSPCSTIPVITCIPVTPVPFLAFLGMARNSRDTRGCVKAEGITVHVGAYIPLGLG